MAKNALKISTTTLALIIIGLFKMEMFRQKIPKSLFLLFDSAVKFVISLFFVEKKKYFNMSILIAAILFNINKFLFIKSFENLSLVLLSVLSPIKLFFVIALLRLFYDENLNVPQYISMFCIMLGNCIVQLDNEQKDRENKIFYILCSIIGNFFGAVGVVYFDKKIRARGMRFWDYMYTYTLLSLFLSVFYVPFEYIFTDYEFSIHLQNTKFYFNIAFGVCETLLNTFIVFSLRSLEKSLASNIINVSVAILSNYFYNEKITKNGIIALVLTYVGVFVFEYYKKKI